MHFVVELLLDPAAEDAVRALSGILTDVPADARPHVSLAAYSALDAATFQRALAELAARQPRVDVTFASWGAFPSAEGVLFLAPVPTPDLLALHARVAALVEPHPLYRPGVWVPHCTLAIGPAADALPRLDDASRGALPIRGRFEAIALVQYPPRRELDAFALR